MDLLLDALLAWIEAETDYETADLPRPTLVLMRPPDLTREYYSAAPQLLPSDGVDDRLLALYSAEDGAHGTIYVLSPEYVTDAEHWEDPAENPIFREIVLHELIHHIQWQTGAAATWPCPAHGETEAYLLGGRYLRETRTDDPIPNRTFWAHAYSIC
ncbi:hypothetical protein [Rubellimicrobium roseum]|uniref:Neutral zinc metallopeptidase n=1 Tax=Rubellimicrobium roseum TaxID=687525 RepID=A0A5C4NM54_9RHOB|nr:hypothetical protein [Rubellimicrobium roseum]TNC73777.1 hypothetical protein FHG71_04690 [Rubellimicrobium roseum]